VIAPCNSGGHGTVSSQFLPTAGVLQVRAGHVMGHLPTGPGTRQGHAMGQTKTTRWPPTLGERLDEAMAAGQETCDGVAPSSALP